MKIATFILPFFVTVFAPIGLIADKDADIRIEWRENYKLHWEDFQGVPREGNYSAMTCSDLDVKSYFKEGKMDFQVSSSFMKKNSWTKSKSEKLLAHEQIHFDITELHARMLRKTLEPYKGFKFEPGQFQEIIKPIFAEWSLMEKRYDKETRHGLNKEAQKEWEEMIAAKLKELDLYKKTFEPAVQGKTEASQSQCGTHSCSIH
jgi:hypothetical protein